MKDMKEKIAVVGIGCIFPDAPDFTDYWKNIVEGKNSVKDISDKFWRKEDFYDPDITAEDKFYTTTGAYVDPVEFDSLEFGISPKTLESTSVEQLFALIVAKQALMDAGMYGDEAKEPERMRTGVIISSGIGSNGFTLAHRTEAPKIRRLLINNGVPEKTADRIVRKYKDTLPDWDKDCTPGFISNVVAGRISNRFNLGGITASVDAACGSSLGSIKFAVDELRNGSCDCMLAGGINLSLSAHSYMMFCKTPAIARSGKIKPFDESADGMILGDGAGIVVLKRLEDAQRDGNKIYAVIREVGAASDARARSIYAPSKKGQIRCLNNAYTQADIPVETIGLIEAHGTGTVAGDTCEIQALSSLFANESRERKVIIGSVKSQIGHLRLAAGISGFIKTVIALHEKVLPASINVSKVNKELLNSNLCVLKKPKAWIVNDLQPLRRAGVSAFGFGGTNFHVILEEAETEHREAYRLTPSALVIAFSSDSVKGLSEKISGFHSAVSEDKYALYSEEYKTENAGRGEYRLSFTAADSSEALEKSEYALEILKSGKQDISWEKNVYFSKGGSASSENTALLFPGQGTQQVDMLSDIAMRSPEMREALTLADNIMIAKNKTPVSKLVYPYWQTEEELAGYEEKLKKTSNTQPVLAALSLGLINALKRRGVEAKFAVGHSFGELPALRSCGVFSDAGLIETAVRRGELMEASASESAVPLSMIAVMADKETTEKYVKDFSGLFVANENSPVQTVVSGVLSEIEKLSAKLSENGVKSAPLKVSSAFHSPYMENAAKSFREYLDTQHFGEFSGTVIANCTAEEYSGSISELLEEQLVSPVRFTESIEKAYDMGVRVFIEAGNGKVLSGLAAKILGDREYSIIPLVPDRNSDSSAQFEEAMAKLYSIGFDIRSDNYGLAPDKRFDSSRKTKTSYTVHSNEFFLPEKAERIRNAVESVEKDQVPPEVSKSSETAVQKPEFKKASLKERTEMNSTTAEKTVSSNAEVMKKFMDLQKTQLDSMIRLIETTSSGTESERKNIVDCVTLFQNNSIKALEYYFGSMGADDSNTQVYTGTVTSSVPEAVNIQDTVGNPAAVQKEVSVPEGAVKAVPAKVKHDTDISTLVIDTVSEITGFPKDMITADMELESDLGVDSIQKVEIFSAIREKLGDVFGEESIGELAELLKISEITEYISGLTSTERQAVSVTSEKDRSGRLNISELKAVVTKIVSGSTGFPEDMITSDMELESDLGVDSIKVVEIFSELSDTLSLEFDSDDASALSELRTIDDIAVFLSEK